MNRSSSIRGIALPTAAFGLALVAILAIVASGALGRAAGPGGPSPSNPPATPPPTSHPSPVPSPESSDPPAEGPLTVDLDIVDRSDVSVVIDDKTGRLVGARTGSAGDGMSVRWYTLKVETIDEQTLRLSWVGFAVDDELELGISSNDGKLRVRMVQAVPPPNTDSMGHDRVLVLEFDGPVRAEGRRGDDSGEPRHGRLTATPPDSARPPRRADRFSLRVW
jgi:hypothetical protein